MGRDGPRVSCGKKVLNRRILKAVYMYYVEIKHEQAALCLIGYVASAGARQTRGRLSMSGMATHLENGSVKPSGSCEEDREDAKLGVLFVELRVV